MCFLLAEKAVNIYHPLSNIYFPELYCFNILEPCAISSCNTVTCFKQIQRDVATVLQPFFTSTGLIIKAVEHAAKMEHIMDFTRLRCLGSLFSMLHQACRNIALYNANHPDFPMPNEQLELYSQVCDGTFTMISLCP